MDREDALIDEDTTDTIGDNRLVNEDKMKTDEAAVN